MSRKYKFKYILNELTEYSELISREIIGNLHTKQYLVLNDKVIPTKLINLISVIKNGKIHEKLNIVK